MHITYILSIYLASQSIMNSPALVADQRWLTKVELKLLHVASMEKCGSSGLIL